MAKQYSVTYDSYDNWKLPLNCAVGFHLLIALSVAFLPGLFKPKPLFEDIYTVNLVNISEPVAEPEVAHTQPVPETKPEQPPEPVVAEKTAAIVEPVKPAVAPPPVKAVSIKPLKRKIKKTIRAAPKPDLSKQRELEKIKRKKLAEALLAEQEAAQQARLAAEEAARQQKVLEQQLAQVQKQARSLGQTSPRPRTSSRSSNTMSALQKQYYASIINRVTQFWALPEFRRWDPSLQAIVIITISQNGTITNQFFEQRSGDTTFDQFVRKTLQDVNPLPAIPPALKKRQYEIGLRFKPESIR